MYLESSKDILNLVLAFSALTFTFFVCWLMWYLISILRDVTSIIGEIHDKIDAIDRAVQSAKDKFETYFGSFGVASAGIKMLGSYLEKRKDKAAEKAEAVAAKVRKKVKKVKRRLEEALDDEDEPEDML